jgi:hypothetical protein
MTDSRLTVFERDGSTEDLGNHVISGPWDHREDRIDSSLELYV